MSTPPQGGMPPQSPPDEAFKALNDAAATLLATSQQLLKSMETIAPTVTKATKSYQEATEAVQEMYDTNRKLVDGVGHWADGVDRLYKSYREVGKKLKEGKVSNGELLQLMTKLAVESERAAKSGFLSGKSQRIAEENTKALTEEVVRLTEKVHKFGYEGMADPKILLDQARNIEKMTEKVTEFSEAWKKVELSPLTKQIRGVNNLLGLQGKHVERLARMGHRAVEYRTDHKEEREKREAKQADRRAALTGQLAKHAADSGKSITNDDGSINPEKLKAVLQNGGAGISGSKGIVSELNRLSGSRFLDKAHQRGDGSVTSGIIGRIGDKFMGAESGGVAGAMGMMGKFAGPLSIVMSIGELAKDLYDKTVQSNIDTEKGLGTSGIFSGSDSAGNNFKNIRHNLTPGWVDPLNVTYEKQMNVAKAMSDSGLGLADLTTQGGGQKSGFNTISKVAFDSARLTGLDETAGTKEIIKLLQVYHMSLESTDGFFKKLLQDTRAAGISTTKYLSILDDLTSQFDTMGKSIDGVTTMMRMLGRTGLQSADSIKKSMEALIGAKSREMPEQAFVGQQYLEDPEGLKGTIAGLKTTFNDKTKDVADAMDGLKVSHGDLSTSEGLNKAQRDLAAAHDGDPGNTAYQTVGGNIQQALVNLAMLHTHENLLKNGDTVAYAGARGMIPTNPMMQMQDTMKMMKLVAKSSGTSEEELLNSPEKTADAMSSPALRALLQTKYHISPDQIFSLNPAFQGGVSTMVTEATKQQGDGAVTKEQYAHLAEIAKSKGISRLDSHGNTIKDDRDFIQSLRENGEALDKLKDGLAHSTNAFEFVFKQIQEILSKEEANNTSIKAEQLADQTRKSAEVFANAFQHLFNPIIDGMTGVLGWLHGYKPDVKTDMATSEQMADLRHDVNDETYKANLVSLKSRLNEYDKQINGAKPGTDTSQLQLNRQKVYTALFGADDIQKQIDIAQIKAKDILGLRNETNDIRRLENGFQDEDKKATGTPTPNPAAQQKDATAGAADDRAKTDKAASAGTVDSGTSTKTPDQPKGPVTYNNFGTAYQQVHMNNELTTRPADYQSSPTTVADPMTGLKLGGTP